MLKFWFLRFLILSLVLKKYKMRKKAEAKVTRVENLIAKNRLQKICESEIEKAQADNSSELSKVTGKAKLIMSGIDTLESLPPRYFEGMSENKVEAIRRRRAELAQAQAGIKQAERDIKLRIDWGAKLEDQEINDLL